ncbi:MAG: hypothetical protein ACR2PS_02005 [Pseudomonadales bacterium]
MPRSDHDDMLASPRVTPARDEIASYNAKQATRSTKQIQPDMGGGAKFFLFLSFLLASVAAAGSAYLFLQLTESQATLQDAQQRVVDLENRLSSTDESVNESGVAMQVKIKELTSEVDKLWASAWRKNQATLKALDGQVKTQQQASASQAKSLTAQTEAVDKLQSQVGSALAAAQQLKEIQSTSMAQKAELSELSDQLRDIDTGLRSLSKRMSESEAWVDSINAYRRQTNRKISELEQTVQAAREPTAAY